MLIIHPPRWTPAASGPALLLLLWRPLQPDGRPSAAAAKLMRGKKARESIVALPTYVIGFFLLLRPVPKNRHESIVHNMQCSSDARGCEL